MNSEFGKYFIGGCVGIFLTVIFFKLIASKQVDGGMLEAAKRMADTVEFRELTRTDAFRKLLVTPEFRNLVSTAGIDYITKLSQVLK